MATTSNFVMVDKESFAEFRQLQSLQGYFVKTFRLTLPTSSSPLFVVDGKKDLRAFMQDVEDCSFLWPGLPMGVITQGDLPSIIDILNEIPREQQLSIEPITYLVVFKNGRQYLMVEDETELANTDSALPAHTFDHSVSNNTEPVFSTSVGHTSSSDPSQTNCFDAQPAITLDLTSAYMATNESITHVAEPNAGLTTVEEASCSKQSFSDSQPALTIDSTLASGAANAVSTTPSLTPMVESSVYFAQDIDGDYTPDADADEALREALTQAMQAMEQAPAASNQNTDVSVHETLTLSCQVTSLDANVTASSNFDSDGTFHDMSNSIAHTTLSGNLDSSFKDHGTATSTPKLGPVDTPSNNFDSSFSVDGAAPITPQSAPYATPSSYFNSSPAPHATPSVKLNSSSSNHGAAASAPKPASYATTSGRFDSLPIDHDAAPGTPTPAPRSAPMHSRARSNGGLPSYGEIAKEAFHKFTSPERPAGMIKFEHIYQYAEEHYPAVKPKGEHYKSGFRHAVPKAFIKVEGDRKPDSGVWWTLDEENFGGDNSERNRRKPRVAESVAPETPRKRRAAEWKMSDTPNKRSRSNSNARAATMAPVDQVSGQQPGCGVQQVQVPAPARVLHYGHHEPQLNGQQTHHQQTPRTLQRTFYDPVTQEYHVRYYQPAKLHTHQCCPTPYAQQHIHQPSEHYSQQKLSQDLMKKPVQESLPEQTQPPIQEQITNLQHPYPEQIQHPVKEQLATVQHLYPEHFQQPAQEHAMNAAQQMQEQSQQQMQQIQQILQQVEQQQQMLQQFQYQQQKFQPQFHHSG